uniref:Major facilitator superfamily (MFS) profile domain-containing protein n=1 Tax=Megaselia scalaris TaxID=36166 RepID=T1GQX5_MEGSC
MVKVPRKPKALEDIPEEDDIGIVLKFESAEDAQKNEHKSLLSIEESLPKSPEIQYLAINGDNNFVRSASAAVVQNVHKQGENEFGVTRSRKISTPVRVPRNQTFTQGDGLQMNSQSKLNRINMLRNSSKNQLSRRSPSTSSFQYLSTPFHGSTLSFQPKEFSSHLSLASGTGAASIADNQYGTDNEPAAKEKSKFFDLSLLKDPMYLVILISNSTNAISYTNFIILLPAYGISLGFDKSLAAYLISIVSTTDLIGRIGGSALSDLNLMPKTCGRD